MKIIPATYSRNSCCPAISVSRCRSVICRIWFSFSKEILVYSLQPHRLIQSELPRPIPWNSTELAEAVPIISHQKIISLLTREVLVVCLSQYLSVEGLSVRYDSPSLSFLVYSRQPRSLSSSDPAHVVTSGCLVKTLVAVSVARFPKNKFMKFIHKVLPIFLR